VNILALDLGTQLGWALGMGVSTYSGSESFAPRRHDGPAQRYLKFRAKLTELASMAPEIHAVYFEVIVNHGKQNATRAAHVYGAFEALLYVWCELNHIPCHGVPVGSIKKNWTGKGNANKDEMFGQAQLRGFSPKDHNAADALAILDWARRAEAGISPQPPSISHAPARDEISTPFDRETT
jgi:Holliday junction resolvasome RuvABC endonuclease subunit